MSVGLMCRNHLMGVLLLLALSRLGVKIKLINPNIAPSELNEFIQANRMQLLICDPEIKDSRFSGLEPCLLRETTAFHHVLSDDGMSDNVKLPHIKRGGVISVFTGGSSGKLKDASRQMSIFQFLPPFYALLQGPRIDEYDSVFLSLPMFHGFGLATLIISLLMGKKICLMSHFDAEQALKIIKDEKVEVLPVVPAMLGRLWQVGNASVLLKSVRCVISGGDRLDRKWVELTNKHLGNVIYNLFGTSEAGFFMMATPEELMRNEEVTIGRPIHGVKCRIMDIDSNGAGTLWVRSGWAMIGMKDKWQNTGDLVCRNPGGLYFYRGRTDNMVVCGGENVYPEYVERVINRHPDVLNSVVFPVADPLFGNVLNAQIELIPGSALTLDELQSWLHSRISRAEMPHHISIGPISISETGKMTRNNENSPVR